MGYSVVERLVRAKTDLKFRSGKFLGKVKCEFLYDGRENRDWKGAIVITFSKRGGLTGDNSLSG